MKILHISAYALRGGCEKNCYHFVREAKEHEHSIFVLGDPGPMSDDWTGLGVEVRHLQLISRHLLGFRSGLAKAIDRNYDLAIIWSTVRLPIQLNVLSGKVKAVKVYLGNPLGSNYITAKDRLLDLFLPRPKNVMLMACSSYTSESYRTNAYFNRFQIKISLNPVALPSEKYVIPPGANFNIGMVARLDPIKDHDTVIRGFMKIRKLFPASHLHMVGDGILKDSLKALVTELKLNDHVTFHGDVSNVYDHLRRWNVFVYATTMSEGLGSAVAEAMAVGLPCVLSDLPMLRELAPSPGTVAWFPEKDATAMAEHVVELLLNRGRAQALADAAFIHAQHAFSPKRFVNEYLNE